MTYELVDDPCQAVPHGGESLGRSQPAAQAPVARAQRALAVMQALRGLPQLQCEAGFSFAAAGIEHFAAADLGAGTQTEP